MKKAYITFKKGYKYISNRDFEVTAEDWREGAKGAEMVAHLEVHWFYLPTSCGVVLDGWRYYFRITYNDYKNEYGRILHLPEFKYTKRIKVEEVTG